MKSTVDLECTLAFLFALGMCATGHYLTALVTSAFILLRLL